MFGGEPSTINSFGQQPAGAQHTFAAAAAAENSGLAGANAFSATLAATPFSGAENVRQEVMKIYQQYNPSEMQKAEAALLKYAGKEQVLLDKLRKKYVNRANFQS